METFSASLAIWAGNSPVPGEFPTQRPVTRSFDVFFDLRQNKQLSKQSWGWWFETLSRPLWRHRNVKFKVNPGLRISDKTPSINWHKTHVVPAIPRTIPYKLLTNDNAHSSAMKVRCGVYFMKTKFHLGHYNAAVCDIILYDRIVTGQKWVKISTHCGLVIWPHRFEINIGSGIMA